MAAAMEWAHEDVVEAEDAAFDAAARDAVYSPVVDRYYKKHYATNVCGRPFEDMYILEHNNGLLLLMVAPSHPLRAHWRSVVNVDFNARGKQLSAHRAHGKSKKGALQVQEMNVLCEVTTSDGSKYLLRPCVRATLLETNPRLIDNPALLSTRADGEGYIAIMKLKPQQSVQQLKTEAEYKAEREATPAPTEPPVPTEAAPAATEQPAEQAAPPS